MGTTAQKLQAIQNSKAAIKSAIEAKGVSDVGDVLADYATKIGQISGGGSSGDPRYEVNQQGELTKKSFAVNWFNDLTSIPNYGLQYAYYGSNVTSVSFPNLTSVGYYGMSNAFYGCTSLTAVDLSSLTSVRASGLSNAFQGCTALTSVDLSSLTSVSESESYGMSNAFRDCTSLTSVSFPSLTSVSQYGLSIAFYNCTSLTSVDLSKVTSVRYYGMFSSFNGCTSLRNVLLTKLSSSDSAFNNTFNGCTHLELVDFSQATAVPSLSNVNAFSNTNNYYRIVVPNALYNQWIAATNWSNPSIVTHIEKAIKALTFKAGSVNSTISLDAVGTPPSLDLEYSTDNGVTFSPYTVGTTITLTSVDDTVMFRAGSTGQTALADDSSNYHKFTMTGSISIDDDISWLLNKNTVPSTTALADYAFYGLFKGCAALQNAPELPWTTMGEGCYGHMFEGCTALTDAPDLPSTSLDDYCYEGMFKGCTSITEAPTLPATTLATGCYNEMFYGCSSLDTISLSYTGNFSTTYFNDWVYGVAASGTFVYFGQDTTVGTSAIPSGWTIASWLFDGLTFTAKQSNSTVAIQRGGSAPTVNLQYTTDSINWNTYTVGTTITLSNVGDKVGFRATTTNAYMASSSSAYNYFATSGLVDVDGNVLSLLNKDFATATVSPPRYAFERLFNNSSGLGDVNMSALTTIASYAFERLLTGSSATSIDLSNVTTINAGGIDYLCDGCSSMKSVKLTKYSYNGGGDLYYTFSGCANLEVVDFSHATQVVPLWHTAAFQNTNNTYKVVVPDALYSSWTTATNWSNANIVGHIVRVSDYTPAS